METLENRIEYFSEAISRLNEAINSNISDDFIVDLVVKRFEFTYEMAKRTLISAIAELKINAKNPREVFKHAYQQQLISSLEIWDEMNSDRNDTSHEYNKKKAAEIYSHIPAYAQEFKKVLEKVKEINA